MVLLKLNVNISRDTYVIDCKYGNCFSIDGYLILLCRFKDGVKLCYCMSPEKVESFVVLVTILLLRSSKLFSLAAVCTSVLEDDVKGFGNRLVRASGDSNRLH